MAGKLDITMKMFSNYKGSVQIIQTAYTCTGSAKAETILYTCVSTHCVLTMIFYQFTMRAHLYDI